MKIAASCLVLAFLPAAAGAQQAVSGAGNAPTQQTSPMAVPDGGVTQVLQSVHIPPLLNAPFTAVVQTEWIRPLPGSGTFTVANQRQVARDSLGRIYQERWFLVPKEGKVPSKKYLIQIFFPETHTFYSCYLLRTPHQCVAETYPESSSTEYRAPILQNGPLPSGDGFRTHEDLGLQDIEGIATEGARDTITYNPGVIGNDKPFNVTREFWFAANLGIDLKSQVTDPSFGKEVFTLLNVSSSAPDPKLFQLPDGFEVVDRRKQAMPAQ